MPIHMYDTMIPLQIEDLYKYLISGLIQRILRELLNLSKYLWISEYCADLAFVNLDICTINKCQNKTNIKQALEKHHVTCL